MASVRVEIFQLLTKNRSTLLYCYYPASFWKSCPRRSRKQTYILIFLWESKRFSKIKIYRDTNQVILRLFFIFKFLLKSTCSLDLLNHHCFENKTPVELSEHRFVIPLGSGNALVHFLFTFSFTFFQDCRIFFKIRSGHDFLNNSS